MTFKNRRWAIVTDTSVVRAGDVPPSEMVTKALAELPAGDGAVPAVEQIPVEVGTLADQGTPIKGKLQLIDNQVDAAKIVVNGLQRIRPGAVVAPQAEEKVATAQ